MLLVLNSYLWKSLGCFALLVSAYYTFSQWTRIVTRIYFWLKYIFAVPPADSQQSTWPGETWPSEDTSEVHYSNNLNTKARSKTDE